MSETTLDKSATRIIDSVENAERSALEAVRRFVDTVDGAFPDLGTEDDSPRRKIIDAAFKMVEQLVNTSNKLADNVVQVTARAMDDTTAGATKK